MTAAPQGRASPSPSAAAPPQPPARERLVPPGHPPGRRPLRRAPRHPLPGKPPVPTAPDRRREHPVTGIEELLSRALLVRERTMPRDIVPPRTPAPAPEDAAEAAQNAPGGSRHAAAEDLRALCQALVRHTPPRTMARFVTHQVPEPRAALVLACVLQLTDTNEGARGGSTPPVPDKPPPTAFTCTTWHWGSGTPPTSGTGRPTTSSPRPGAPTSTTAAPGTPQTTASPARPQTTHRTSCKPAPQAVTHSGRSAP